MGLLRRIVPIPLVGTGCERVLEGRRLDVGGRTAAAFAVIALLASGCRQVLGLDDLECTPAYATAVDYATAANPRSMVVVDINVDNSPDVITANATSANVSRFLSNRDGTLAAKSDHGAIQSPTDIAAGDVTGDGITDLVVLSSGAGAFMVMRGDGNAVGGLTPEPTYAAPSGNDIEVADLDRNGTADVVIAASGNASGQTLVLLAGSDGRLGTANDVGGPTGNAFVRAADFTGDGILDLLVAEPSGSSAFSVHPGNGDGTFGMRIATDTSVPVLTLVVGDVNNDLRPDVVVGSLVNGARMLTVMLGVGDGTFTVGTPAAVTFHPYQLVDMNGDNILDMIAEVSGNSIGVLVGAGDGTFGEPVVYAVSGDPNRVFAANLDDDTPLELIALLDSAGKVAVVDGTCSYAAP